MKKYLVVVNRMLEEKNYIKLNKGDCVSIYDEFTDNPEWKNWILCKKNGIKGWVPKQILDQSKNTAIVLEHYDSYEFTLEIGEILIQEQIMNGWIYGYKAHCKESKGWAPLENLKEL
jgi:hypothetical protein